VKERDKTRLEILAQDLGIAGVLEALADYCDRSADLEAEANEGKAPAPLEIELRTWSKRIRGPLEGRSGKKVLKRGQGPIRKSLEQLPLKSQAPQDAFLC